MGLDGVWESWVKTFLRCELALHSQVSIALFLFELYFLSNFKFPCILFSDDLSLFFSRIVLKVFSCIVKGFRDGVFSPCFSWK